MSLQPVPVVPISQGLEKDKEPFILDNDAFPVFFDAYIYQGKIRKKEGNVSLGRLVQIEEDAALGNTGASPFVVNIFTAVPGIGTIGIDPGSVSVTIAAPIGPLVYSDDGNGVMSAAGPFTGTVDYQTGDLSIDHAAGAASAVTVTLNYYTARPVMGLFSREKNQINAEDTIAFDIAKANIWSRGSNRFLDISTDIAGNEVQWTSTDKDFFWAENYYNDNTGNKLFWATNNIQYSVSGGGLAQDGIQIYNGSGWEVQTPQLAVAGGRFLNGCQILISYRNRMIALNTLESSAAVGVAATRYYNRARWSQNGVPYTNTIGGLDATSWYDDQVGKGGYIDAPTSEAIVSCEFYKDILIVFFERSTWQLSYTGDPALPFIWNRINTNFGCESTHSVVGFDKGIFAVTDKGIVVSDSYNVERIDQKIPLEVYNFHNENDGPIRVHGIRDYYYRFVYWTFPNHSKDGKFPDRVLSYNYEEGSYSLFKDSYTCFGYYQAEEDITWSTANFSWVSADFTWNSNRFQSDYPAVAAGNQVGFVSLMNFTSGQGVSLYITNPLAGLGITQESQCVVTIPSHNLSLDQFVQPSDVLGMIEINSEIGKIVEVIDENTVRLDIDTIAYTPYVIGGLISVLSNIEIVTKRYNPAFVEGSKVRLHYIDLFLDKTDGGEFDIELYIDSSRSAPIDTITVESTQNYGPTIPMDKMWQRVYLSAVGQFVQFKITMNDEQMKNISVQQSKIVINALNLWLSKSGSLMGYSS